jgi:hypothetical protein
MSHNGQGLRVLPPGGTDANFFSRPHRANPKFSEPCQHSESTLSTTSPHFGSAVIAKIPEQPECKTDPSQLRWFAKRAGAAIASGEDVRHIQDRDIFLLREKITTKLNLEMGVSEDILQVALRFAEDVCLVPENRRVTTEGGLDCVAGGDALRRVIERLGCRSAD